MAQPAPQNAVREGWAPPPASDDEIEAFIAPGRMLAAASVETTGLFEHEGRAVNEPKMRPTLSPGARKVGWTIRDHKGTLQRAFGFNINPQAITRAYGSRTQLQATRGAFYVDNFGQGPTAITLTQMVGSGKPVGTKGFRTTARYDVAVGFYENIYKYVVERAYSDSPLTVRFHDYHWQTSTQERVFFPANSLTVQRSVSQHNIWLLTIQMISLDSFREHDASGAGLTHNYRLYKVKRGDTLHKLIYSALSHGKHKPTSKQYNQYLAKVTALNRKGDDISKTRTAPIYNNAKPPVQVGTHKVKRLQLYPGEIILLPK